MILLPGEEVRRHLAHALTLHLQWCRRSGLAAPDELRELLATLQDWSGQGRPNLGDRSVLGDGQLVDYETAAKLLSVSPRTVRRMCADGRLRPIPVGRRRLLVVAELKELADVA